MGAQALAHLVSYLSAHLASHLPAPGRFFRASSSSIIRVLGREWRWWSLAASDCLTSSRRDRRVMRLPACHGVWSAVMTSRSPSGTARSLVRSEQLTRIVFTRWQSYVDLN